MPAKKKKQKKTEEPHVRKLTGMGNYSMYVTLPKSILREFRWRKGQKVVIRKYGSKIVIEDWKR